MIEVHAHNNTVNGGVYADYSAHDGEGCGGGGTLAFSTLSDMMEWLTDNVRGESRVVFEYNMNRNLSPISAQDAVETAESATSKVGLPNF